MTDICKEVKEALDESRRGGEYVSYSVLETYCRKLIEEVERLEKDNLKLKNEPYQGEVLGCAYRDRCKEVEQLERHNLELCYVPSVYAELIGLRAKVVLLASANLKLQEDSKSACKHFTDELVKKDDAIAEAWKRIAKLQAVVEIADKVPYSCECYDEYGKNSPEFPCRYCQLQASIAALKGDKC